MYSFLVDGNSEHIKVKGVNKNFIEKITHKEYKDVFLHNKSLRHSLSRIQSKNHRIGIYEINKISLSSFDNKIISNTIIVMD